MQAFENFVLYILIVRKKNCLWIYWRLITGIFGALLSFTSHKGFSSFPYECTMICNRMMKWYFLESFSIRWTCDYSPLFQSDQFTLFIFFSAKNWFVKWRRTHGNKSLGIRMSNLLFPIVLHVPLTNWRRKNIASLLSCTHFSLTTRRLVSDEFRQRTSVVTTWDKSKQIFFMHHGRISRNNGVAIRTFNGRFFSVHPKIGLWCVVLLANIKLQ